MQFAYFAIAQHQYHCGGVSNSVLKCQTCLIDQIDDLVVNSDELLANKKDRH